MDVSVKEWMSGSPVSVTVDASALEVLDLMVGRGIRHLPVVDAERRVVGVVSVEDLRAALPLGSGVRQPPSPEERVQLREWGVAEIMTHAPETLESGASLGDAADLMAEHRISCLPIVDSAGRLEGILTDTDALRALGAAVWSERVPERRDNQAELGDLVDELRRERERLTQRLDRIHGVERELSAQQHDVPMDDLERSADLREVDLAERLDAAASRRLEMIDRALDHAAQGRLSLCDGCGGAIPVARLRALPGTTLCVACARAAEAASEGEAPFEHVPGGRAETGRAELGAQVYTRFGEGQLLRIAPFGTCRSCGDVEGQVDVESGEALCGTARCQEPLTDVCERAVVRVGEREVYVDPAELGRPDAKPYD